jgi:hypothetical protein
MYRNYDNLRDLMIDQFIIISGIILYYLYRPHVKAYFGKVGRIHSTPDG